MKQIEKEEKLVFRTYGKKERLESIAKSLNNFGIGTKLIEDSYGYSIYIAERFYTNALIIGNDIVRDDSYSTFWVDYEGVIHPLKYIPIMYGVLPETVKGRTSWNPSDCPEYLKQYINNLKEYCGVNDCIIDYDSSNNAFTFLVKAPFLSYELISNRCKGFNYVNEYNPFIEIYYTTIDNRVDRDKLKMEKDRLKCLETYFENSLFHDIIRYPEGSNIGPHNDNYPHYMIAYHGDTFIDKTSIEKNGRL